MNTRGFFTRIRGPQEKKVRELCKKIYEDNDSIFIDAEDLDELEQAISRLKKIRKLNHEFVNGHTDIEIMKFLKEES